MNKRTTLLAGAAVLLTASTFVLLAAVALAAGPGDPTQKPGKVFSSADKKFDFMLNKLTMKSDLDLTSPAAPKHKFSLEGFIHPPTDLDIVAFGDVLAIRNVTGADDVNLLDPKAKPSAGSGVYNAVLGDWAPVKVNDITLTQNPYTIKVLEAEAMGVLAKKREDKVVPAVVMEDATELAPGFKARISALKMGAKRDITITVEYTRSQVQTTPFIEGIYALNGDKKEIGGGRWTAGSPLGAKSSFTAIIAIAPNETHAALKLVMVTEFEFVPVTFEVKEVFQK
jgi:hypothetical protein